MIVEKVHLFPNWILNLQENMADWDLPHSNFKLIFTTEMTDEFDKEYLASCAKLCYDMPKDFKHNLQYMY